MDNLSRLCYNKHIMSNTRHLRVVNPEFSSDRDGDFDGTFPGSKGLDFIDTLDQDLIDESISSHPAAHHHGSVNSKKRPRTRTTPNYHTPIVLDRSESYIRASHEIVEETMGTVSHLGRKALNTQNALIDQNGRVVLGSRAFSPEDIEQYLADNPGSYVGPRDGSE